MKVSSLKLLLRCIHHFKSDDDNSQAVGLIVRLQEKKKKLHVQDD